MDKISNQLVIVLLVLIVLSTVISTIGFMNIETKTVDATENQGSGRAALNIVSPEDVKGTGAETDTGKASINIINKK